MESYEKAKQSKEYQMLIKRGWKDISTERQQKNGTFIIQCGMKHHGYNRRTFGVFVHKTEEGMYKVKTGMESLPWVRKELETSYENAFSTIYKIQSNYEG